MLRTMRPTICNYAALPKLGITDGTIEIVDTQAAKLLGGIKINAADPGGPSIEPSGKRVLPA